MQFKYVEDYIIREVREATLQKKKNLCLASLRLISEGCLSGRTFFILDEISIRV